VSGVASALQLSRPNLSSRRQAVPRRRGRPPAPDAEFVAAIRTLIADLPTYGYRRVHALLRRQAEQDGRPAPNVKRVYRVMKVHGLLLQRHASSGLERRHEGRVAVDIRNTRWCSDGLEIGCDNGERVRVAFALDCCDREAMSFVATTGGITSQDVRDLMGAAQCVYKAARRLGSGMTLIRVPSGTRSYRSITSWLSRRMQPEETARPMDEASGVPCRR